jgi:hypothetical protein
MNLTPTEREEILQAYAESCRLRFIRSRGKMIAAFAIDHPQQWVKNCRDDTIQSIRDGKDTWERIAEVARKHQTMKPSTNTRL